MDPGSAPVCGSAYILIPSPGAGPGAETAAFFYTVHGRASEYVRGSVPGVPCSWAEGSSSPA